MPGQMKLTLGSSLWLSRLGPFKGTSLPLSEFLKTLWNASGDFIAHAKSSFQRLTQRQRYQIRLLIFVYSLHSIQ